MTGRIIIGQTKQYAILFIFENDSTLNLECIFKIWRDFGFDEDQNFMLYRVVNRLFDMF